VQGVRSIVTDDRKDQLRARKKAMTLLVLENKGLLVPQCAVPVGKVLVNRILVEVPADMDAALLTAVLPFVIAETAALGAPETADRSSNHAVCLQMDLVERWDMHLEILLHSRDAAGHLLDRNLACQYWLVR
jgi:hypothetical protein